MIAVPLSVLYEYVRGKEGFPETGDPSLDMAFYLAMAYGAYQRLKGLDVKLQEGSTPLLEPALERAYRELVHIRATTGAEWMNTEVYSRYGRLYEK